MHKKMICKKTIALLGIIILILDSKTSLEGAKDGLEICTQVVIPSLFPFIFLNIFLVSCFIGQPIPIFHFLLKALRVSENEESMLICSFLGGYPSGAQAVYQNYKHGSISKEDATKLIGYYNNAGPAFIFGMLSSLFDSKVMIWQLWIIHIAASIFVRIITQKETVPFISSHNQQSLPISEILMSSVRIMVSICAWVILFRIISTFTNRWFLWRFPNTIKTIILGVMELTNGCLSLVSVTELKQRFCICSMILGFGGFCITLQTASVCTDLPMTYYLFSKFLHAVVSLLLSISLMYKPFLLIFLTASIPIIFILKKKN